jgi:hypothetical protein
MVNPEINVREEEYPRKDHLIWLLTAIYGWKGVETRPIIMGGSGD